MASAFQKSFSLPQNTFHFVQMVCNMIVLFACVAVECLVNNNKNRGSIGDDNLVVPKDLPHKVMLNKQVPAASSTAAEVTEEPIPVTLVCVMSLVGQYFLVYTASIVARTYQQLSGNPIKLTIKTIEQACSTVNYAPMLSVLFVASSLRATEMLGPDGQPQSWVHESMKLCTWSLLFMCLLVVIFPLFGLEPVELDKNGNIIAGESSPEASIGKKFVAVMRYVLMICLYGGFATVCAGVFLLSPPVGVPSTVSPAVECTINLCMQYFLIYLLLQLVRSVLDFYPSWDYLKLLEYVFNIACQTVNFAPMLSVLFLGARLRARQIDPIDGAPPSDMETAFFICTYSVLVQALMVISTFLLGGKMVAGETEGDIKFEMDGVILAGVMSFLRYTVMFSLYGSLIYLAHGLVNMPGAESLTPDATMTCIMILSLQFFFVYTFLFIIQTCKEFNVGSSFMGPLFTSTFENAKSTVQFCPMLAVLFLAVQMRALHLSANKGSPQRWSQDMMYLCTFAVLAQLLMVFLVPLVLQKPPVTDKDGNVSEAGLSGPFATVVTTVRYVALIGLYGGATAVLVSTVAIDKRSALSAGA